MPDCTIHFINVLNTERAKQARKKYVAPYKLPDRFAFSAALFLIAKDTIIVFCHIKSKMMSILLYHKASYKLSEIVYRLF